MLLPNIWGLRTKDDFLNDLNTGQVISVNIFISNIQKIRATHNICFLYLHNFHIYIFLKCQVTISYYVLAIMFLWRFFFPNVDGMSMHFYS